MILEFLGGARVHQCEQVTIPFPGHPSPCCDSGFGLNRFDDPCDRTGLPDFPTWGFRAKMRTAKALDWGEIKQEIDGGRPFAFSLLNATATSSHMYVVVGYSETAGQKAIIYYDPFFNYGPHATMAPYEWYRAIGGAGGGHMHQYDYFAIH